MMCMAVLVLGIETKEEFHFWILQNLFQKEEHLVTFHSTVAKTQIDYLLLRKSDKRFM